MTFHQGLRGGAGGSQKWQILGSQVTILLLCEYHVADVPYPETCVFQWTCDVAEVGKGGWEGHPTSGVLAREMLPPTPSTGPAISIGSLQMLS